MNKSLLIISLLATQTAAAEIATARQSELLYFLRQDCGSCHGMTLKGGLGPALLPETLAGKPKSYLVTTIMEGRKGTAMPPWKSMLSQQEAEWLTEQLQKGLIEQTEMALSSQVGSQSDDQSSKDHSDKQAGVKP
jgi:cytochrome c55X